MRCGHCKRNDQAITVNHVRACQMTFQSAVASYAEQGVAQEAALKAPVTEDGIYQTKAGEVVKVVWNQAHTNLYAKVWEPDTESWGYTAGLLRLMTADMRLTAEQAREFGALYGRCVFCSRELTDERSIEVGYGPVCAEREGLPWGEVE